jgi:hypothetical protein
MVEASMKLEAVLGLPEGLQVGSFEVADQLITWPVLFVSGFRCFFNVISILFLERPESRQRIFSVPFCYVVSRFSPYIEKGTTSTPLVFSQRSSSAEYPSCGNTAGSSMTYPRRMANEKTTTSRDN